MPNATSPRPRVKPAQVADGPMLMDFATAMSAVTVGRRVRRQSWLDRDVYCCLAVDHANDVRVLSIHRHDAPVDEMGPLLISEGDMTGRDWIIAE